MRNSPRLCLSVAALALLFPLVLSLPGKPAFAADNQVTFIFGGDVEWSLNARPPTVRYRVADPTPYGKLIYGRRDVRDQVTGDWPPIPYVDQGESGAYLKGLGLKGPSDASTGESLSYPLLEHEEYTKDYSTDDALLNHPLLRLAPIFHGADLVMVNCEGANDQPVRYVYLDVPHSTNPKPSWYGESVGHYEGDTLVVDTIGLNDKTFVDNFRTPHTEKLHVVERFRLVDGSKAMQVDITSDDPDAFNAPWSVMQRYDRIQRQMDEQICAENNLQFFQIPVASNSDF